MKKIKFTLLAACMLLAIIFTISCSLDSSSGSGSEATFYYSIYEVIVIDTPELELDKIRQSINMPDKPSFNETKEAWSKIRQLDGYFRKSGNGLNESSLKKELIESDITPKEADDIITVLKTKGNGILFLKTRYQLWFWYLERE
jgi:hypothetical protein